MLDRYLTVEISRNMQLVGVVDSSTINLEVDVYKSNVRSPHLPDQYIYKTNIFKLKTFTRLTHLQILAQTSTKPLERISFTQLLNRTDIIEWGNFSRSKKWTRVTKLIIHFCSSSRWMETVISLFCGQKRSYLTMAFALTNNVYDHATITNENWYLVWHLNPQYQFFFFKCTPAIVTSVLLWDFNCELLNFYYYYL